MKKTISMLVVFGLALSVVLYLPDNSNTLPGTPTVMYNSVLHSQNSTRVAQAPTVKPSTQVAVVTEDDLTEVETLETSDSEVVTEEDVCGFPDRGGEEANYKAQLITVRKKFRYTKDEMFRVKVYLKNDGNMPWFSPDSDCLGVRVYLGTTKDYSRESRFLDPSIDKADNGAISKTSVRMDKGQMRVDPGEIVSYTFWSESDDDPSVYREYFSPYIEDGGWMEEAEFKIDIYTGVTSDSAAEIRKKLLYAAQSMNVDKMTVSGDRSVEVDLSDQKLWLKIDDYVVREFTVSTGKSATPTPTGNFNLFLKNEVRVGHAPPHYIMPRFQMFTSQGAGLHALPSLGSDGGTFWTEALEHIGQPMSHGCIRMLPEDADFAFQFTEVGDPIYIHY